MFLTLQILAVVLVSVAMALALAHALELPGKLRLSKEAYLARSRSTILVSRSVEWSARPEAC